MAINTLISELIGIHTGDGTLYKTNSGGIVWEVRGGLDEKEYYNHIVILLKSIFNLEFKAKFRSGGKNGCWGIQICKKEISSFFINNGFLPRSKTKTIQIPRYIKESNKKVKLSFIRGYFDTDGCLRFDRYNGKTHSYPKIEFASVSEVMIKDLSDMLKDLGFRNYTWISRTDYKLCVAGRKMLEKWINEVEPKNAKHLNKYYLFKRQGYVLPATVA
jgi:intein/homing endonuclease